MKFLASYFDKLKFFSARVNLKHFHGLAPNRSFDFDSIDPGIAICPLCNHHAMTPLPVPTSSIVLASFTFTHAPSKTASVPTCHSTPVMVHQRTF